MIVPKARLKRHCGHSAHNVLRSPIEGPGACAGVISLESWLK